MASQAALVAKNPPVSTRVARHAGSIPGLGRSPGGRHGNPLQYSCLENPIDRGAWQATVHGIAKSGAQLRPKHSWGEERRDLGTGDRLLTHGQGDPCHEGPLATPLEMSV